MSEMVERVARTINAETSELGDDAWDDLRPAIRENCIRVARAAIEAMREPTTAMLSAGVGFSDWSMPLGLDSSPEGYLAEMKCGWQAMIEEALK